MDIFALLGLLLIAAHNFLAFVRRVNRPWWFVWGLVLFEVSLALYHPVPIYLVINTISLSCAIYGATREPP